MTYIPEVRITVKYSKTRSKIFKTDENGVANITDLPKGVYVTIKFEKNEYFPVIFEINHRRQITQNKINVELIDANTNETLLTDTKDLVLNTEIDLSYSVEGYNDIVSSIIVRG